MQTKEIRILVYEYSGIDELPDVSKELVFKSREALENAYAPYSKFQVGAAVMLENGKVLLGNNQENSAYPAGLCAERVALFYANANYPESPIKAISISAKNSSGFVDLPVKPCGDCRQALLESEIRFKSPIKIILDGKSKIQVLEGARDLLPLAFTAEALD